MSGTEAAVPARSPAAASRAEAAARTGTYADRARALLLQRVTHVLVIAFLSATLNVLRALPRFLSVEEGVVPTILYVYVSAAIMSALIVAAVSLAQAAALRYRSRTLLMLLAAWAAVPVGCLLYLPVFLSTHSVVNARMVSSMAGNLMFIGWEFMAIGTAVALYYAAREHELNLAAAAREADLERARLQRSTMASRLAVLRARVEPEFLFGALGEVQALYRRDRGAADDMIDALIAYLRAALPQIRGEISTIGSEIDLVLAYLAVLQLPRGGALNVEARVEAGVRNEELPATVLLSLAQAAFSCADGGRRRRFTVSVDRTANGARIVLGVEGGGPPDGWYGDDSAAARRLLGAYFGAAAHLGLASRGAVHEVCLTLRESRA